MRMVQKASTGERFNHLVLLASFFILMWTGLGFLFAKLTWMNVVLGGTLLAKEIHKWSGIVFGVSLLITMGNYLGEALSWSAEDSEWLGGLGGYFSHKKMPDQGRLNAGQKLFYLVLLVFGLTIMVSGLLLWAGRTEGTLRIALVLHNVANIVLVTTIPIHIYLASLCNPGTARIMSHGTVPVDWARKKHAKWVRSLGID